MPAVSLFKLESLQKVASRGLRGGQSTVFGDFGAKVENYGENVV